MDFELEGAEGYEVMCGHEFLAWKKSIGTCLCPGSSLPCLACLFCRFPVPSVFV